MRIKIRTRRSRRDAAAYPFLHNRWAPIPGAMLTSQELQDNIQSAVQYRERRHPQWTENYRLYRDTVITNRLTQRQSVNVPLMKETLRTIRANIAPVSDLTFESRENDKQRELLKNEYWRSGQLSRISGR